MRPWLVIGVASSLMVALSGAGLVGGFVIWTAVLVPP
jgi:hypothetical protein